MPMHDCLLLSLANIIPLQVIVLYRSELYQARLSLFRLHNGALPRLLLFKKFSTLILV